MSCLEETTQQGGRSPHLICLARGLDELAHLITMLNESAIEMRPCCFRIAVASDGRVMPGELGQTSAKDESVHRAEKSQRDGASARFILESLQHHPHGALGIQVGGGL